MAKRSICRIEVVRDKRHRGVGFLIFEKGTVTARTEFKRLEANERKWLETSFDWWTDCYAPNKKRFHGWDKSEFGGKYTKCFVFKLEGSRFYGFLCHPKQNFQKPEDKRYYFCVLVAHAPKNEWDTESKFLQHCEDVRLDVSVQRAVNSIFKE